MSASHETSYQRFVFGADRPYEQDNTAFPDQVLYVLVVIWTDGEGLHLLLDHTWFVQHYPSVQGDQAVGRR